ncbi:MAG: AAA family ATPase [Myxococcales bacterium]|nr:AAA family ATPase [Myxococcales bacterium]
MKLTRLVLKDFRCFGQLDLDFASPITLLVGVNGAGKSSILEALSASVGLWGRAIVDSHADPGSVGASIRGEVVRRQRADDAAPLQAAIPEEAAQLSLWLELPSGSGRVDFRVMPSEVSTPGTADAALWSMISGTVTSIRDGEGVTLPVHAAYSVRRATKEPGRTFKVTSRASGYIGSMGATVDVGALREWLGEMTAIELQEGREVPERGAVERAVLDCLEGASSFIYQFRSRELLLTLDDLTLPLSMYSDGIRSLVAMVADIAWRCAVLNPHFGADAARETPGVVLIDEIDLHLHPSWQWRVLDDLHRAFPKVQFIVTTHSPQVIASVDASALRVLGADRQVHKVEHSKGWDVGHVLEDIMGVPSRRADMQARLQALDVLIDNGELDAAKLAVAALRDDLGSDYPDVTRAEWSLRMAEVERDTDPSEVEADAEP